MRHSREAWVMQPASSLLPSATMRQQLNRTVVAPSSWYAPLPLSCCRAPVLSTCSKCQAQESMERLRAWCHTFIRVRDLGTTAELISGSDVSASRTIDKPEGCRNYCSLDGAVTVIVSRTNRKSHCWNICAVVTRCSADKRQPGEATPCAFCRTAGPTCM